MAKYVAINLYKRAIPPGPPSKDDRSHQYYTLGHFDGMDIFESCKTLDELWDQYKKQDPVNDCRFVSQPLVLAYDTGWLTEDEYQDVLKDDTKYPFLFLALLNTTNTPLVDQAVENILDGKLNPNPEARQTCTDWMQKIKEKLNLFKEEETATAHTGDFKFACFYPLNISKGAILFKSQSYTAVVHALATLQRCEHLMGYSFSISGLSYNFIKEQSRVFAGTKQAEGLNELNGSFDIVINNPEKLNELERTLYEAIAKDTPESKGCIYTKSETVGCTDVRLMYYNVDPARLVNAYRDIILPGYQDDSLGISSLVSSWTCPLRDKKYPANGWPNSTIKQADTENAILKLRGTNMDRAYRKLFEAAHTLRTSPYAHYINPVVQPAIKALIDILPDIHETEDIRVSAERFLVQIQSLLSSTLRSDRQFFEAPGFNMTLMETPLKLTAAYNACMYEVRSTLVEEDELRKYAFMAVPDLSNTMLAYTLFPNGPEDIRLFTISIPAEDMFSIRKILPHIVHEMGHIACNSSRHRPERYTSVIRLISQILVWYIYGNEEPDTVQQYYSMIKESVDRHLPENKCKYYMRNYTAPLKTAVKEAIIAADFQVFEKYEKSLKGKYEAEKWQEYRAQKEETARRRMLLLYGSSKHIGYEKIVNLVLSIMSECFADIVMLLTLHMSFEEYLLTFFDANVKEAKYFDDRHLLERISTVKRVMVKAQEWTEEPGALPDLLNDDDNLKFSVFVRDAKDRLRASIGTFISETMQGTIDEYFSKCFDSIQGLRVKSIVKGTLITEKLYRQSFGAERSKAAEKGEDQSISLIQQLLGMMEAE